MNSQLLALRDDSRGLCRQRVANAMIELFMAWQYANASHRDIWDFAVEGDLLRSLGATRTDFRFLMAQGLVRHGVQVSGIRSRVFHECQRMSFCKDSAFVLTEAGYAFASELVPNGVGDDRYSDDEPASTCDSQAKTMITPVWNVRRHELTLGDKLVKRFKWRAANQELILTAFQEEDWAGNIADPLPPRPNQDPKRRLHDTIKCLNRKQVNNLVKFRGDGSGQGVLWEHSEN